LVEYSRQKHCKYYVALKNMCLVVTGKLAAPLVKIRSCSYYHKKVISVALYQMEFKFKGLSADRIRQLNAQIEDLKHSKVTITKRHERSLRQLEEATVLVGRQVEQWEGTVAANQAVLDNLLAIENKKRKQTAQDYFPLLKRLYCEYESNNLPYFKRGLIIKKNGLNLSELLEWPEVLL